MKFQCEIVYLKYSFEQCVISTFMIKSIRSIKRGPAGPDCLSFEIGLLDIYEYNHQHESLYSFDHSTEVSNNWTWKCQKVFPKSGTYVRMRLFYTNLKLLDSPKF